ncbi:MAG TPA: hypothetical protein DIW30_02240 [Bacteroidales bacterium]|nr:hypothetical protein [Bacteroidales bacterium]
MIHINSCVAVFVTFLTIVPPAMAQNNRQGRNDRMRDEEDNAKVIEKTYRQPCQRYDDGEYYAASGFIRVKMGGEGERDYSVVATKLLASLRQQVKQKIGGKYQGAVRDYFDQYDVDDKFSAASHIESAGEQIIDTFLNDTEEDCRQYGDMDEGGYANLYMGILVKKSDLINSIVEGLQKSQDIPAEVKSQIREREQAFRNSLGNQLGVQPESVQ